MSKHVGVAAPFQWNDHLQQKQTLLFLVLRLYRQNKTLINFTSFRIKEEKKISHEVAAPFYFVFHSIFQYPRFSRFDLIIELC